MAAERKSPRSLGKGRGSVLATRQSEDKEGRLVIGEEQTPGAGLQSEGGWATPGGFSGSGSARCPQNPQPLAESHLWEAWSLHRGSDRSQCTAARGPCI